MPSSWFGTDYQPYTWFQHGIFALVIPLVFALFTRTGTEGVVISSWLVLLYFVYREERNEDGHKEGGSWRTPEEESGVTPLVDKYGDLVGPITATIAYTGLWLLDWFAR